MTDHTKRILNRIRKSLELYTEEKIDEKYLLANVEALYGSIEDEEIEGVLSKFSVMIDEAIHIGV